MMMMAAAAARWDSFYDLTSCFSVGLSMYWMDGGGAFRGVIRKGASLGATMMGGCMVLSVVGGGIRVYTMVRGSYRYLSRSICNEMILWTELLRYFYCSCCLNV